jgi:hypothetical protein
VLVVACDLAPELADAGAQLVGREVDLADPFVERQDARSRW